MSRARVPIVVWVALGSAVGACARWGLGLALAPLLAAGLPWATLTANASGSLLIGLYAALTAPDGRLAPSPAQRQFVMSGLCGGFTTFSLFSAEVVDSVMRGRPGLAALIVAVSVPVWLASAWLGHGLGLGLNRLR